MLERFFMGPHLQYGVDPRNASDDLNLSWYKFGIPPLNWAQRNHSLRCLHVRTVGVKPAACNKYCFAKKRRSCQVKSQLFCNVRFRLTSKSIPYEGLLKTACAHSRSGWRRKAERGGKPWRRRWTTPLPFSC